MFLIIWLITENCLTHRVLIDALNWRGWYLFQAVMKLWRQTSFFFFFQVEILVSHVLTTVHASNVLGYTFVYGVYSLVKFVCGVRRSAVESWRPWDKLSLYHYALTVETPEGSNSQCRLTNLSKIFKKTPYLPLSLLSSLDRPIFSKLWCFQLISIVK